MSKVKLFCFPYAGGSAIIYKKWGQFLDSRIDLRPVELAGRGKRFHEPLYENVAEAIDDVYDQIIDVIDAGEFAFFGHSMGAMISYQLCQKLQKLKQKLPSHVFFSGRGAPHVERPDKIKYHLLNEDDFISEVLNLGGTPPELFENSELMDFFLPLLKSDFKLAETDLHSGEINPLYCNISVLMGKDEDFIADQCVGWEKHSHKQCAIHYFKGGHFFLNDQLEDVVGLVNDTLRNNLS